MQFIYKMLLFTLAAANTYAALEQPVAPTAEKGDERTSVERFTETVKDPSYAHTILPHDFNLMVDLLTYGKQTDQPREYTRSVFKMFGNLVKSAEYVNPSAFSSLLRQIPDLVAHQFSLTEEKKALPDNDLFGCDAACYFRNTINSVLYDRFSTEFDLFRKEPEKFLENISGQLADLSQDHLEMEQLRQAVIRFLEIGLGKLIWSPQDGEKTWESAKRMGASLATLLKDRIVDDANDLVDLYWTIVHRYCYFIDVAGSAMPLLTYQQIKADIENKRPLLLEMEEQEECLESRSSVLNRCLLVGEAKRRSLESTPATKATVEPTKPQEPASTDQTTPKKTSRIRGRRGRKNR